jgi:[3-methyl-2-oxobutanoate dehydrogenase (acetyl-transferring)] kinase
MSPCLQAFRQTNTRLFQQTLKTDRQLLQIQNFSTKLEDVNQLQPRMIPYTKVQQKKLSKPRQQNYSMFSEYQQASQATARDSNSRDNSNDQEYSRNHNPDRTTSQSFHESNRPIQTTLATKPAPQRQKKSDNSESRERLTNIRQFYSDLSIDRLSDKPLIRLNPMSMMYMGVSENNSHLLKTANYLRHELPIRLAHMIKEIRHLPFIIGVNPHILEIHERCVKTFHIFDDFDRTIADEHAEQKFSEMVFNMLEMNKDLLGLLCDGFKESRRYIRDENYIRSQLNAILSSRLGIRLLCEHFIALNKNLDTYHKNSDQIGIIHKQFSPRVLVEKCARMVTRICNDKYGMSPKLKLDGHTNVTFPYLSLPLEYILPEILKNSFRATVENHKDSPVLPDVTVTIALNERDCIIRIRDRGGGIPHDVCDKIFDYHFTTVREKEFTDDDFSLSTDTSASDTPYGNNPMGMICEASSSRGLAVMHGYGFGLPTSRAYAEYLGGSLTFQSMQGIGSDFYLRIALIDNEPGVVRI